MRRVLVIALSVVGLMGGAGVAYADPPNPHPNHHAVEAVCDNGLPNQASDNARDNVPFC